MTAKENKELVRRYYQEVVSTGNVERLPEFVSPAYVEVYNGTEYSLGLDGARSHVLGIREAYPDFRLTVDLQIAEGDLIATQVTAEGTHEGVWLGMSPTGKRIKMTGVNVDRVVGGLIVEHGGAANLLEPLLAAGAIRITDPAER